MQGLFLLRERQRAYSSRHAAGAALLLLVALLAGCSDVALAHEMPASEPDPDYNNLVAKHLKDTLQKSRILRRIRNIGFSLGTLVQGLGLDSRYAVQTDACNTQTYAVFDGAGPELAKLLL